MNLDPKFLETIPAKPAADKLEFPVTHVIPATIMGSGLGANQTYSGDYDIQLFEENMRAKHGLDDLRLGDFVAIMDSDHSFGRIYKQGAISIGIVVHSNSVTSGHGPGVTTLLTSSTGRIVPKTDPEANISTLLNLRKDIQKWL